MDSIENKVVLNDERKKWVDVAKAIAMIFVYLGHWITTHLGGLAYGFHLQLFFLVAGFFASRMIKKNICEFVKHVFFSITVPFLLWVIISFVFNNLDNSEITIAKFWGQVLKNPSSVQPNYWFFSAYIGCIVVYYTLSKIIKKQWVVLVIAVALHFLIGETPILRLEWWTDIENWFIPIRTFNNWIGISSVPQYLFWYSLGNIAFKYIEQYMSQKQENKTRFYFIGGLSGLITITLFFYNIKLVDGILGSIVYFNNFTFEIYKILCAFIIIMFVFFISKLFEESRVLNSIGKSSMNFMGLEYITQGYFALFFLPMMNLGMPTMDYTIQVITITCIQIAINLWMSNRINKYIPILNGDYRYM